MSEVRKAPYPGSVEEDRLQANIKRGDSESFLAQVNPTRTRQTCANLLEREMGGHTKVSYIHAHLRSKEVRYIAHVKKTSVQRQHILLGGNFLSRRAE